MPGGGPGRVQGPAAATDIPWIGFRRGGKMRFTDPGAVVVQSPVDPTLIEISGLGGGPPAGGAAPIQIDAGDAGTPGLAVPYSRQDHEHPVNTLSAPLVPAPIASVGARGAAATLLRSDHVHEIPLEWRREQIRTFLQLPVAIVFPPPNLPETAVFRNLYGAVMPFIAAEYIPSAVVTPVGTNTVTFTYQVRTALGALVGILASLVLTAAGGPFPAFVPVPFIPGPVVSVGIGEMVTLTVRQFGIAGVTFTSALWQCDLDKP